MDYDKKEIVKEITKEIVREINTGDIEPIIESILFVSGEPVRISRLSAVLGVSNDVIEAAADNMKDKYSFDRRGIRLVKLDDSLQLCSSPEFADYIRLTLETRKKPQLSGPSLEVLAVIAYFQPVTRAYIEQLRGVESSYTVGVLSDRGLIEACGRLDAPGRPMLYRTTHVFLRTFGLESLRDLPELPHVEPGDDNRESIHTAILELKERQNAQIDEADEETEVEGETGDEPETETGTTSEGEAEYDIIDEVNDGFEPDIEAEEPNVEVEEPDLEAEEADELFNEGIQT